MRRPVGVMILATVALIGGAFALLDCLWLSLVALFGASSLKTGMALTTAAVTLVLGVLDIVWGIGALRLRSWAWALGVALAVLYLLGPVLNLVLGSGLSVGDYAGIVFAVLLLVYLFISDVRQVLGRA